MSDNDPLRAKIIGCCFKVHTELGPGFTEQIYHNALKLALNQAQLEYQTEKTYKVFYQGNSVGYFKVDLVIDDKVIIELKALSGNIPTIFESQVISYLKASGLKVGLIVNFGNTKCQIMRFAV